MPSFQTAGDAKHYLRDLESPDITLKLKRTQIELMEQINTDFHLTTEEAEKAE
ncbi:MAG TPA: hypothetical protein PL188_02560 [Candidatus Cloacimonadota bacterium]|jgi:hypothetical protein|nr:hypothetical protein [Candidatus Cloacimonadota bacterium]